MSDVLVVNLEDYRGKYPGSTTMTLPRTLLQTRIRVIDRTGRVTEIEALPCDYFITLTPEAFDKLLGDK